MCEDQESELANRGLHVLATATKPAYMNEAEFAVPKAQAAVAFSFTGGVCGAHAR